MRYKHILARALNTPLLLSPGYAAVFFAALGNETGDFGSIIGADGQIHANLPALAGSYQSTRRTEGRTYRIQDGVAVIPIDGTLMHKSGYIGSSSGAMGYDGLEAQITQALSDRDVKGILLDINSPGGEVSGVQALGDIIANADKPVWAHANELAASAAYWLASQADRVILTPTAEVGSIGVLTAHGDYSQAMDKQGVKVTLIYSGAHKVDGHPYGALPEGVLSAIQADIDALRTQFAAAVARGRGITEQAALDTEAALYRGQTAVEAGLADQVASFNETLAQFSNQLAITTGSTLKGTSMSKAQSPSNDGQISLEDHTAAVAAARAEGAAAAKAEGHAEGLKAGAEAERARIFGILGHEAAKGREATAQHLAKNTSMSAEEAAAILATLPQAAAAPARDAAATLQQMAATAHVDPQDAGKATEANGEDAFAAAAARQGVQLRSVK